MTIGQFVELILDTSVSEAREWLDRFVEKYNDAGSKIENEETRWENYCQLPLTPDSVQSLAQIFSAQVSFVMRNQPREAAAELSLQGHRLLQEIHQKARDCRIETDIGLIDWILEPRKKVDIASST